MKKLLISKGLQNKIPIILVKEIYIIICSIPATEVIHFFKLYPTTSGVTLCHMIPSINFNYNIEFSKDYGIDAAIEFVAYNKYDRMIISLFTELK